MESGKTTHPASNTWWSMVLSPHAMGLWLQGIKGPHGNTFASKSDVFSFIQNKSAALK